MIFGPVFLILASSFTVYVSTMVDNISDNIGVINTIKPAIMFLMKFAPYFMMWIIFTLLYMVMPNTRVRFRSALVAGIMAGTIFQIIQFLYIDLQVGVSKYSALYGSFAAFPLFIIWMQLSWLVVLLGAELSFANQNVGKYEFEFESENISQGQKRILTIMLLNIITRRFVNGDVPLSATELAKSIQIPVRISRELLYSLSQSGLITEITVDQPRERLYQPATDIRKLNLSYVLSNLDNYGTKDVPVLKNREYNKIVELIKDFGTKIEEAPSNVLVSDI
jgi:membrane protein